MRHAEELENEMSTEHTPGPWTLEQNGAAFNVVSQDRGSHFCMLIGMLNQPEGEHAANAALIARAPEMAERIEQLESCLDAAESTGDEMAEELERLRTSLDTEVTLRREAYGAKNKAEAQRDALIEVAYKARVIIARPLTQDSLELQWSERLDDADELLKDALKSIKGDTP